MNELNILIALAKAHPDVIAIFASYWIFMAAVTGMPAPTTTSGVSYRWLYGAAHALSANIDRFKSLKPQP